MPGDWSRSRSSSTRCGPRRPSRKTTSITTCRCCERRSASERPASSTSRPCRAWVIASWHRSKLSVPQTTAARSQPPKARQEIRYCTTSDGVRLAYASVGNGPPLVKASNWLTHLDFEWGSPIWRHWYAALSLHHRLVRYDERGNGMSQRDVPDVSFDTWVRDLETVVDAAGPRSISAPGDLSWRLPSRSRTR